MEYGKSKSDYLLIIFYFLFLVSSTYREQSYPQEDQCTPRHVTHAPITIPHSSLIIPHLFTIFLTTETDLPSVSLTR